MRMARAANSFPETLMIWQASLAAARATFAIAFLYLALTPRSYGSWSSILLSLRAPDHPSTLPPELIRIWIERSRIGRALQVLARIAQALS